MQSGPRNQYYGRKELQEKNIHKKQNFQHEYVTNLIVITDMKTYSSSYDPNTAHADVPNVFKARIYIVLKRREMLHKRSLSQN